MLFPWFIAGFAAAIVYASFFEWMLHKHVMHWPLEFITC